MLNQKGLDSLVDNIKSRELLTRQDPKDMSYIVNKLRGRRMSIHGFWFHCALFRFHSNPDTYEALTKHASALQPGGNAPDWAGMQTTLAQLYSKGKVWGGMFYPSTLRAGKSRGRGWRTFRKLRTPAQKAKRDILAFKIVWDGITAGATQPGEFLNEYFESRKKLSADHTFEAYDKARTTFAAFYDAFDAHMHSHTSGFWGDYSFKILLDVACNISLPSINDSDPVCPDGVLSRWPIACPAYGPTLKLLLKPSYKKLTNNKVLKRQVLMRVHFVLSGRLGANNHNLSSTAAQLCWQKRDTS